MKKGIDSTFLHYGIRREDMEVIEAACQENGIDEEWMKESILKMYHEERNNQNTLDEKALGKIIKKALKEL